MFAVVVVVGAFAVMTFLTAPRHKARAQRMNVHRNIVAARLAIPAPPTGSTNSPPPSSNLQP
jgi:hypothetical protein